MKILFLLILVYSHSALSHSKAVAQLFQGISKNNLSIVQTALKEGADPNSFDHKKYPQTTALHKAVELKRFKIATLLLTYRADVNQRHPLNGETPLMLTARKDLAQFASLLLYYGADVNIESPRRQSALHLSAYSGSLAVAQLLLKVKDIDVNAQPHLCALAMAARQGHSGLVLLLKRQSGSRASSPLCVEKALEVAEKKKFDHIVAILLRE